MLIWRKIYYSSRDIEFFLGGYFFMACPVGYKGDGFYRSKEPTNSIKVLKEKSCKGKQHKKTKTTQITYTHAHTK